MTSPIAESWLFATVPIDNPHSGSGTGFLVARLIDDDSGLVILVTNKHVIHADPAVRAGVDHVICRFNNKAANGAIQRAHVRVDFAFPDGSSRYREHPDADTDVAAINITDLIVQNPSLERRWITYELFGDSTKREEPDITVGEEVMTVGYPLGLRQGDTNFPIVRQGVLATTIGYPIKDQAPDGAGGVRNRELRAFLVDGATIPGSSGSPVVLKPVIGRQVKRTIVMGTAPPVLLGIIAETKYAPVQTGKGVVPGFAGLGLAFDVETIRETIELFFT